MSDSTLSILIEAIGSLQKDNKPLAKKLLSVAKELSENNSQINSQINALEKVATVDNGPLNLHLGVHKTATTYLQEHLANCEASDIYFPSLDEFRKEQYRIGIYPFLQQLDWSKSICLSDENILGNHKSIPMGHLYPKACEKVTKYLGFLKHPQRVKVFLSLRPMTEYMISHYCESLRHRSEFLSYESFIQKLPKAVEHMSWYPIFRQMIVENPTVEFIIFDFREFKGKGERLLNELSFGRATRFDQNIQKSRQTFKNRDIFLASNKTLDIEPNNERFDPYSIESHQRSVSLFEEDLIRFSTHDNVALLQ